MTEILKQFAAGRIRSRAPRRKRRGTGRLLASFSLVFVIAAFLFAGCDDDARTSREKEAAAIKDVIRQVNEINRDFPGKQPETYGEKEDAYRAIVEKCNTDLKQIDISQCPLRFQLFFKQYVQAVDDLSGQLGNETREKKGFEARRAKRAEYLSLINKAKESMYYYGVMTQMEEAEPEAEDEDGAPSIAEKAPSSADGGSTRKNLIPGDIPKEIQDSVDSIVMQAVNRLEIDRLATKEDVRAAQTLPWIIGGVLLIPVTVCLVLLFLICVRGGAMFRGKQYADEQPDAVVKDRNDLMLELAELCYRHREYSECVRHLMNAKRLGLKEAKRMYSRFLDDSEEFRDAAALYQFLEKPPRPS